MTRQSSKPAPLESEKGQQKDDNIDDLGRRPDGTTLEQPVSGDKDKASDSSAKSNTPGRE